MLPLLNYFQGNKNQLLKISEQHNDFYISSEFEILKSRKDLSFSLVGCNQSQISLIRKCLEDFIHLKSLHIIVAHFKRPTQSLIQDIFKPLELFKNLKVLKVEIDSYKMLKELSNTFLSQSRLEVFELTIPNINQINLQGITQIEVNLQDLKRLKEFRLKVNIDDNNSQQTLNVLIDQINSLQTLTSLAYELYTPLKYKQSGNLLLSFENLRNLQELEVITDYDYQFEVVRFSEQIQYLQSLVRFKFQTKVMRENQLNKLFNSVLKLRQLSELFISLEIMSLEIQITIGEEVLEESQLRKFNLTLIQTKPKFQNYRKLNLNLRKNIINLKNLESLTLDFANNQFLDEFYHVLSNWKNNWTQLKEFTFRSSISNNDQELLKIHGFLKDCLIRTQSIIHLKIDLDQNGFKNEISDFLLSGLANLCNLQTLSCKNLYDNNIQNGQKNCFQKLQHLQKLVFGSICNTKEIFYIGNSLPFMTELTTLSIYFASEYEHQHLEMFSRNLKELTNLKYLTINFSDNCKVNANQMQVLFLGIQTLTGLRQFDCLYYNQEQYEHYFSENAALDLIKELTSLNELRLRNFRYKLQRYIQKISKRLVTFQNIQY